jgi:hypothetical protein
MRRFLFLGVLALLGCRSVREVPIASGRYRASVDNAGAEMKGVEIVVEKNPTRAVLVDGSTSVPLVLRPLPKEQWRQDCGTMSGYSVLESRTVSPETIELRGKTVSLTQLTADCGAGVELHGDMPKRWIFDPM